MASLARTVFALAVGLVAACQEDVGGLAATDADLPGPADSGMDAGERGDGAPDAHQHDAQPPDAGETLDAEARDADARDAEAGVPDAGPRPIVFFDGEFAPSGWTQDIAEQSGIAEADPMIQVRSGGDPGAFARIVLRVTATADTPAVIFTRHFFQPAVHDPSARPLCSIRLSIHNSDADMVPATREAIVAMFVQQGGATYWTERFRNNTNGWASSPVWTEQDLVLRYGVGPTQPRLTSGPPMRFGFIVGASRPATAPGPSGDVPHRVDNFRVVLETCR